MNGTILEAGARGLSFAGAAADSRAVEAEQLFFALPGERVDGFDFVAQAVASGAAGVVVARGRGMPAGRANAAVIAVDDPRRALGDLARAVRAAFRGQVVAVTGSNGKTTTKELVAAALRPLGDVLRTPGNFNTDVGLPLTILLGDRGRGGLGAGDGDARARRDRLPDGDRAPRDRHHHQRRGGAPRDARLDRRGGARQGRAVRGPRPPGDGRLPGRRSVDRRAGGAGGARAAPHLRRAQPATCGSSTSFRRAPAAPSSATPSAGPRSWCGCRSAARTTPATAPRRWRRPRRRVSRRSTRPAASRR